MENKAFKTLITVSVYVAFATVAVSAILFAIVAGDWLYDNTRLGFFSWVIPTLILMGCIVTLGVGLGIFLWYKSPERRQLSDPLEAATNTATISLDVDKFPRD